MLGLLFVGIVGGAIAMSKWSGWRSLPKENTNEDKQRSTFIEDIFEPGNAMVFLECHVERNMKGASIGLLLGWETGIIVAPEGFVLACASFLYDKKLLYNTGEKMLKFGQVTMTTRRGETYNVSVFHLDTLRDVVLLKIQSSKVWECVRLPSSSTLEDGQKLVSLAVDQYLTVHRDSVIVHSAQKCPLSFPWYFHACSLWRSMRGTRGIVFRNGSVCGLDIRTCEDCGIHGTCWDVLHINSRTVERMKNKRSVCTQSDGSR